MGGIRINTAAVRGTGDDVEALSRETQERLRGALDSSSGLGGGWVSAGALEHCASMWEPHVVELAGRMGQIAQRLRESADDYDERDREAESRLRAALDELGKV